MLTVPANRATRRRLASLRRHARSAALVGLVAVSLGACAEQEARNQVRTDMRDVAPLARVAQQPLPFADLRSVKVNDGVYVGATAHQLGNDRALPPAWRSRDVSFVESKPMDFREIANLLSSTTSMPVSFAAAAGKGQTQAQAVSTPPRPSPALGNIIGTPPNSGGMPRLGGGQGGPAGAFSMAEADGMSGGGRNVEAIPSTDVAVPPGKMRVQFSGHLATFLDQVAGNFGVSWMSDGGRIIFSSMDTKVFDVPALPIVLKLTSSVSDTDIGSQTGGAGGGGGSSSGGAGSTTSLTSESAFELWKDINASLKSIVGNGQGGVEVSGTTGTVTVTGSPDTIAHVAEYVKQINRRLSKEVVLALTVYQVTLTRNDNYAFDINAVFNNAKYAAGAVGTGGLASLGSAASLTSDAVTGTAAAAAGTATGAGSSAVGAVPGLAANVQQGFGFAVLNPSSKFGGSSGVLQALSTTGDVSIVNSQTVTTVNGVPVPFTDLNTRGYLSSTSTTAVAGSANNNTSATAQTTLTPGSVTTGFALNMTPHVNNDGTVLVNYALDMSELNGSQNGFDTFSSGGQTLQLPNVNRRKFVQQAVIPAGSTLVLSGIERTKADSSRSGTGSPDFPLLGGSRVGGMTREVLVVAITPEIVDLGSGRASR